MKTLSLVIVFLTVGFVKAQDTTSAETQDTSATEYPTYFYVGLSQDSYNGLTPYCIGSIGIGRNKGFTFYGILRSMSFGGGISFAGIKGKLVVTPNIGLINGRSLSGGTRMVAGEGIVPGLWTTYQDQRWYLDQVFFYYKTLRKEGPITSDYFWYWLTFGYNLSKKVAVGAHFEHLYISRITDGDPTTLYLWLGPYFQFNFSNGTYFRVTGGWDSVNEDFVRIGMFFPVSFSQ